MDRVFADTFYWVALIHRNDAKNKAVLEWSRAAAFVTLFTTEEVLTEVLVFCCADEELRTKAVKTVPSVLVESTVHVFASLREKKKNLAQRRKERRREWPAGFALPLGNAEGA